MSDSEEIYFDERLVCYAKTIEYDFNNHSGSLYIDKHGCCDMTGCIRLFKSIDPLVTEILTYSSDEKDTSYRKNDLKWFACRPDGTITGDVDDSYFDS